MGLWDWFFGRKKGLELVSLPPPALPAPAQVEPPPAPAALPAPPAPPPKPAAPTFGIDNAIKLMRALPLDEDPDLVLRVVRKTLRSTGVSVEELVDAAKKREASLVESIAKDRASIEQLERDIASLKTNIDGHATQLKETESVRQRLQEAIESESKVGPLMPPQEMERLKAEAAAAAASRSPPADPKPSTPPAQKGGGPPPLRKSTASKAAPPLSPKLSKAPEPAQTPQAPPTLEAPRAEPESTPMPISTTDIAPPSEPTVRRAVDVSGMDPATSKEANEADEVKSSSN